MAELPKDILAVDSVFFRVGKGVEGWEFGHKKE